MLFPFWILPYILKSYEVTYSEVKECFSEYVLGGSVEKIIKQHSKVKSILKVVLLSYLITGFLLLLFSFFMLKMDLSNAIVSGGIVVIYIISTLVGGFFMGKGVEKRRFLWGFAFGGIYFILLLMVSLLFHTANSIEISRLLSSMFICLFSGMLGGMIS